VLKIYMHQFWFTIDKKDSTSYWFKIDKKRIDALPSDEEIVYFIKELRHKGDIKSVTDVVGDEMYQPWRTFASIINKCLSRKITGNSKKPASPSKVKRREDTLRKRTLVIVEEEPKPAKKKKAPATTDKSKGIDLLSEAALLEEAQVPDEPKGKSIDTHEGTGDDEDVQDSDDDPQPADDERTDSENQETNDDDEESHNEFVHTPEDYVPTNDETNDETKDVDEEEYDRIDKELYGDVNVRLTDAEQDDESEEDADMTDVAHV
ncbi:hypothetical protein Tco_1016699, partial [Tanacetum coccineum]